VVETEINVQAAVAVIVGHGSMRERSRRSIHKVERIAPLLKLSIALIDDQEVLEPLILEIRKERTSGAVQHADSSRFRDILESAIAAIAVQPVGKSRGLANIEIIQTVVVKVSRRQSSIPVNIHSSGSVQNRAPVVHPVEHLIFVRLRLAKSLLSDIQENGLSRAAQGFLGRGPTEGSPATGVVMRPFG